MDQVNAAQEEPWWHEFTEQYGKESLRALAKRFGTNPRRLRRAAQRSGLVDEPEAIRDATERLGKLPDASLAEELQVTPEQVKGARKRRGIEAFNPKTLPKPRVRKPKKAKPRDRPRPARDSHRERFVPSEPTVVVKKPSRRPGEGPTRTLGRVEDSGRKLQSTLGRLHRDENSRSFGDPEPAPRRRRVVGADRLDELRGLKSDREPAARGRRRRMPREGGSRDGGGDDDGSGPGARARIQKAFSRLSETLEATRLPPVVAPQQTTPPEPTAAPARVLRRVDPAMAAPQAAKEARAVKLASQAPEKAPAPPLRPAPVQQPVTSPMDGALSHARLWNAVFEVGGERREAVVSAPTFIRALDRVRGLGELVALTPAELL